MIAGDRAAIAGVDAGLELFMRHKEPSRTPGRRKK
jgi:hypothetical protein